MSPVSEIQRTLTMSSGLVLPVGLRVALYVLTVAFVLILILVAGKDRGGAS